MNFIYNCILQLLWVFYKIASLFNSKARNWVAGQKKLKTLINLEDGYSVKTIWFHCASAGEFQQALPIITEIKKKNTTIPVIVSFFSPSGYEMFKNHELVDRSFYLPLDLERRAERFVKFINPLLVIFIKHEVWHNISRELKKMSVPYIFVSSNFNSKQYYFKYGSGYFQNALINANHIFLQTASSKEYLQNLGFSNVSHVGDTRIDHIVSDQSKKRNTEILERFKRNRKLWICGSIYAQDLKVLKTAIKSWTKNDCLLLVPHEFKPSIFKTITGHFKNVERYSEVKNQEINSNILLLDEYGLLSKLYKHADLVYVGGGFGRGIHNILEPLRYHKTTFIGPNYSSFPEAVELVNSGVVKSISTSKEVLSIIESAVKNEFPPVEEHLETFFRIHKGASKAIVDYLIKEDLI